MCYINLIIVIHYFRVNIILIIIYIFLIVLQGLNVGDVNVPVIGGHSGITILPLLSQVRFSTYLDYEPTLN